MVLAKGVSPMLLSSNVLFMRLLFWFDTSVWGSLSLVYCVHIWFIWSERVFSIFFCGYAFNQSHMHPLVSTRGNGFHNQSWKSSHDTDESIIHVNNSFFLQLWKMQTSWFTFLEQMLILLIYPGPCIFRMFCYVCKTFLVCLVFWFVELVQWTVYVNGRKFTFLSYASS